MSEPLVRIRPAQLPDCGAVGQLHFDHLSWHAGLDPEYSPPGVEVLTQQHVARLGHRHEALLVADRAGEIVGFVTGRVEADPALVRWRWFQIEPPRRPGLIGDLYVAEAHRRQGIGEALVQAIRDWLHYAGATRIDLHVLAANTGGLAFWQALGFAPHRLTLRDTQPGR